MPRASACQHRIKVLYEQGAPSEGRALIARLRWCKLCATTWPYKAA